MFPADITNELFQFSMKAFKYMSADNFGTISKSDKL